MLTSCHEQDMFNCQRLLPVIITVVLSDVEVREEDVDMTDIELTTGESVMLQDGLRVTATKHVKNCIKRADEGDVLHIDYVGRYDSEHGEVFDDTKKKGFPFKFEVGGGRVVEGLDRGVRGMCKGEVRTLFIPHKLV